MRFQKRYVMIQGRKVPGRQVSEAETVWVTLASGKSIPTQMADILTLRETNPEGENPGVTYLTITRENLRFTILRFDNVVGLDVDENGALLTLEELEEKRAADIAARQIANAAARAPLSVALTDPDAD